MRTAETWIVTTYFNPCRYSTRRANFDRFLAGLGSAAETCVVVELAFADQPFELPDLPHHVRLRSDSVLWARERLLDLALGHLPTGCTKVAWVDCDVLFEDADWLARTTDALDRWAVVQPFVRCLSLERGYHAAPTAPDQVAAEWESIGSVLVRDRAAVEAERFRSHGHTGFAWAARREVLDTCGFYDGCLTESADHLMAHAFSGTLGSPCVATTLGAGVHARHFARWAARVESVVGGRMGHVPGRLLHLWHGDLADRRYHDHNQELKAFAFDPDRHLRHDHQGLWEWTADAPAGLREWSAALFARRNEDGAVAGRAGP